MKKLSEIFSAPSGFDSLANYAGEIPSPEWFVILTRQRDSDLLTESNWKEAEKLLKGLEGDGEEESDVEVFRFGHWACGWWEALCVKGSTTAFCKGEEISESLKDYPVLNEDSFSEMEDTEAQRVWREHYNSRERVEYIRENRNQFEFTSFSDLRACVRGEHFCGYASELI